VNEHTAGKDARAWGTRWANLDGGTTAHYWLGNAGTACGRDFRYSIYQAYADDPRCQECLKATRVIPPGVTGDES